MHLVSSFQQLGNGQLPPLCSTKGFREIREVAPLCQQRECKARDSYQDLGKVCEVRGGNETPPTASRSV